MIKVKFKGEDITESVSINTCCHDMYAEYRCDTLCITFNDTQNQWDKWQPKTGDEIQVDYGTISTGKMFIDSAAPKNGLYKIVATSVPLTSKEPKSKAWQKIKLTQIGTEIAGHHQLEFKQYGVTDVLYDYVMQTNKSDFAFLNYLCTLEGCAFLVYDGTLVMYSQSYMEEQSPIKSIDLSLDADFDCIDHSAQQYGVCKIERGLYKGEFNAGNGCSRVFIPTIDMTINNAVEAERYAKSLLRNENKNALTGYIRANIMTEYAAASTATLNSVRSPSWNGAIFIYHIRNDYAKGNSKIFFRKPLSGY